MKYSWILLPCILTSLITCEGCRRGKSTVKHKDTLILKGDTDKAKVVVDESFQPIVDEELYIFRAMYPNIHLNVSYAPENTAVNMLLDYTVQVAVLSRDLTKKEFAVFGERRVTPVVNRFAVDAVTLIVNKASTDTNITVSQIKRLLNGDTDNGDASDNPAAGLNKIKSFDTKTIRNIVFDNPNSGLVRDLRDFAGKPTFKQKNIYSLKSNIEVIKYVSTHPDAIGITGFSWLNDPDKDYAAAVDNVKIVGVMDDVTKNADKRYFTPSQNTLALKQYPLIRNLYVVDCTGRRGLGMQFAAFLGSEQGQRIILRSGLLPDDIPGREITVSKKIKQ